MGPEILPALREDLQLQSGPTDLNGAPTWSVYDPVRNRYLRLSAFGFEIIRQWQPGPMDDLIERVAEACGRRPETNEVKGLSDLLHQNDLFHKSGAKGVEQLEKHASLLNIAWYKKLLHHYLFFKIPLIHPDRFLQKTKHMVGFAYRPGFYMIIALLGLLGLFLLLREWAQFTQTVPNIFSLQNLVWGMAALGLSKITHEFAHAYTAARLNCRVPTMGLAFMVMIPMLYTEMSDTWRLVRRRDRLFVASAGMISEVILALLATLLWTLLPDGGLKDGAFMLATVAWIMTLAINLNPFMRFDGYYIFADALGVENLQDRSFKLAKWWIREWFLGINEPKPERVAAGKERILIAYALFTWVYRFFLFLGIAVLVYYMFFKALGIFLFIVELGFFIAMPIWKELKVWWSLKDKVNVSKPIIRSAVLLLGVILFLSVPWQQHINAPAVLRGGGFSLLFPPNPSMLVSHHLQEGKSVQKGEVLFTLQSLDLDYEISQSEKRLAAKKAMLKRQGTRKEDTDRWQIVQREVSEEETRLNGLIAQRDQLTVRAPHDGVIHDVANNLHPKRWLSKKQVMARLVEKGSLEVIAYVGEHEYHRLKAGGAARFISNNFYDPSLDLKILDVAQVNTAVVEHPALVEKFGGNLSAQEQGKNTFVPDEGIYKVRLSPVDNEITLDKIRIGSVSLEASRESIIERFIETLGAVIIRESGF